MTLPVTNCMRWAARDSAAIAAFGRIDYYPFVLQSGQGSIVEDMDGNRFIDFLSSAGCLNVGHAHPAIVQAIQAQAQAYTHYTNAYFYNPKAIEMAEMMLRITPGSFPKQVAFGLTGSDANDGVIKVARGYTGRSKIISFVGAYHGATYGALSLTNISLNMRRKIGATLPDVYAFPFPDTYRKGESHGDFCIQCIRDAFATYLPPEEVAAVIIEPIQGDAGILVPPVKFMQDLYALCREHGILFVSEEVQQGFMRTGKWFGIEHFAIEPDLLVLGKAAGGGMPLSAIVGKSEMMASLESPAHAFTFAGNPVSCAAGLAAYGVLSAEGFQEDMLARSRYLKELLDALRKKYELIGDVRGLGFSLAVDLVEDRHSKSPAREAAAKICYRAWERGLIIICLAGNILRIQPPLIITREEITKAVSILDDSITDYLSGDISDSALKTIKGWA